MARNIKVKKGTGYFLKTKGQSLKTGTVPEKKLPVPFLDKKIPFCCRHTVKDLALAGSIRRYGILVPLVVQNFHGKYRIIAGHRRFEAARALKLKKVPVLEIDENVSAKDAFILGLVSNWRQEFSDMDRARTIAKAIHTFGFTSESVSIAVAPLLGLTADQKTLDLYLKADAMPAPLKDLFEQKKIPFRSCSTLLRFSREDQEFFAAKIGARMRLTSSQVVQAAEWLADVVKRENQPLKSVLARPVFREIFGHATMDPRTRADRFFNAVKRLRFPGYAAYLEQFEKTRSLILREDGEIRIEPPAGFEEKGINLCARVKTPEDLDRILQKLSKSRSALISLFDFML